MPEACRAVVAGSQAFVDALGSLLALRCVERPVVARDPKELLAACAQARDVVVLEYASPEWLDAVRALRTERDRRALAIVAAVSAAAAAEIPTLAGAGVDEAVRCDGRYDPVVWAVDRVLAARKAAAPSGPPPLPARSAPACAGGAVSGTGDGVAAAPVQAAPPPPAVPVAAEPVAAGPVVAPSSLPDDDELTALLADAVAGCAPMTPVGLMAGRVAATLTAIEKAGVSGTATSCDPAPLRAVAVLRLRIAVAAAHARAAGAPDADAAVQLPPQIDAALTALKALSDAAPEEARPQLAEARNALVSQAVQLTETITSSLKIEAPPPTEAAPAAPRAPVARVLSNELEPAGGTSGGKKWAAVVLATALVLVVGWRVAGRFMRPPPRPSPIASLPKNTLGTQHGAGAVITSQGGPIDPAELERFIASQKAKGNVVEQVAPDTWVAHPPAKGAQPPGGAR